MEILPKSSQTHCSRAKKQRPNCQPQQKTILGGWVPHRARQKPPKVDLQTTSRAPQVQDLYAMPKSKNCGVSLEATEGAFRRKKEGVLRPCRKTHSILSPSSIFKGCTVRFAYFSNRSAWKFATKNSARPHIFTCRTDPPTRIAKRVPRSHQKGPKTLLWSLRTRTEEVAKFSPL